MIRTSRDIGSRYMAKYMANIWQSIWQSIWQIYGKYMANIWQIYGSYMVVIWRLYGGYRWRIDLKKEEEKRRMNKREGEVWGLFILLGNQTKGKLWKMWGTAEIGTPCR